jgi:hypothetical protein
MVLFHAGRPSSACHGALSPLEKLGIAEGGLRLHPDTIRALKADNPALGPALRPLWAALALIALVVLVALPW